MAISRALGARIKRREDPRLITGTATYVDDIMLPGLLHVVIVRSPHAHAKVTAIDTAAARRAPGVAAVWTGEDVAARCGPLRSEEHTSELQSRSDLVCRLLLETQNDLQS